MEHGTNNEKNILVTLTGLIIPAFLPPCYAFFEVGAKFISGSSCRDKVEVSGDGILKCTEGDNCLNNHEKENILIEIKSPFPTKENPHVTTYDIPVRYIPQLLCEMEVWESSELWLLCGTTESVTLFQCYHDKPLLEKLFSMKDDLYASEKPNIPTRLHPSVPKMKENLRKYISTHTVFKGEIPALTGEYGKVFESDVIPSAYRVMPPAKKQQIIHSEVDFDTHVIAAECQCLFMNAHTSLRSQASEIVVFMATNKNRIQTDSIPYSFPVAYAMKGSSISNDDLRFMVKHLCEEFRKCSIPILTEVYDVQWHQHITTDSDGNCLTKLSWRHRWQEISTYSKQKCISKMIEGCRVRPSDVNNLDEAQHLENSEETTHGNITIKCSISEPDLDDIVTKTLKVGSRGGGEFCTPVLHQFVTVCKHSQPDLFPEEINFSTCHAYADAPGTPPMPPPEDTNMNIISGNDDHTYCIMNPRNDVDLEYAQLVQKERKKC